MTKQKTKDKTKQWRWVKKPVAKKVFSVSRWLHVYLSTLLFSLMVFFCITGITLNHPASAGKSHPEQTIEMTIPASLQAALEKDFSAALPLVQRFVEAEWGLSEPRSIDMDIELKEINLDYPLPAGYVFVTLLAEGGVIERASQQGGIVALFNDLHKGRHSGEAWSWLLDISAVLMTLFSVTGMVILLQHKHYRGYGLLFAFLGVLSPVAIYFMWVPSL